jgi:hypothetical protein
MVSKIEMGYEEWNGVTVRKYSIGGHYVTLCNIPCLDLNKMTEEEIENALIELFKMTEKYGVETGLWTDVYVFDVPYNCVIVSTKPIPKKAIEKAISTLKSFCNAQGDK